MRFTVQKTPCVTCGYCIVRLINVAFRSHEPGRISSREIQVRHAQMALIIRYDIEFV